VLFAALSAALHLAGVGGLWRVSTDRGLVFDPDSRALAGDTIDVEPAAPPASDLEEGAGDIGSPGPSTDRSEIDRSVRSARRHAAGVASGTPTRSAAVFGAVGARFAMDLATGLTRAFPQAASADPIWLRAPIGSAGSAEVVLVLDEDGRLSTMSVLGAPSPALRHGLERALALLQPRPFTAHAPVTKLRVTARVSRDELHDGLHGDVFALSGGSFAGDVGTAFFALPPRDGESGRRVDIELRLVP
jgi:hypothetical protein